MKSYTTSCKRCSKTFTKDSQAKADQALRMHIGRSHSRSIITPGARATQPAEVNAHSHRPVEDGAPRTKRKYTRRQHVPTAHEVPLPLCPNCGYDLELLATAMVLARQLAAKKPYGKTRGSPAGQPQAHSGVGVI